MKPIYDEDLERAMLGAVMLGKNERFRQASSLGVGANTFAVDQHRKLWRLFQLCEDNDSVIDIVTVGRLVRPHSDVLHEDYLVSLAEATGGYGAATVESYASALLGIQAKREMREQAVKVAKLCEDADATAADVRALLTGFDALAVPGNPFKHFRDVHDEGGDTGVTTGFPSIDQHISTAGYPDGQMTVVRAYHKGGKSTFMLSSFMNQLAAGHRVLYATFADLNERSLKRRMKRGLSTWSKRPSLIGADHEAYERACEVIDGEWEGYVYNAAEGESWDIESFCSWLRYQHSRTPFRCVFVDYAQELTSANRQAEYSEYANARCCSQALVRLAAKVNIPIVVGAQVTEGSEKSGTRTITKGSRVWEEKAGWVLTIQREEAKVGIEITYSRFGPGKVSVPLRWNDAKLRVEA